jgi:hypothetical protein
MQLSMLDSTIVLAYLVGIFVLAQWVSREKAGHSKDAKDYFLASKSLPWWAIGASLIAANISAEQIIGMSGSGYAHRAGDRLLRMDGGATLLIVGKFFLPVFLRNGIYTMPQFLEERYGPTHPHDHGGVLAGPVRVREPHLDPVAGLDRGDPGHRHGQIAGAGAARRVRAAVSAVRRAEGGGADRHRAGLAAGARRAAGRRRSRWTRSAATRG